MGTLTVFASGNKAEIKQVAKDQGKALADHLRMKISASGAPVAPTQSASPAASPAGDIASRLATLDQLRAAGAITDAEYQDRRTKVLDSL